MKNFNFLYRSPILHKHRSNSGVFFFCSPTGFFFFFDTFLRLLFTYLRKNEDCCEFGVRCTPLAVAFFYPACVPPNPLIVTFQIFFFSSFSDDPFLTLTFFFFIIIIIIWNKNLEKWEHKNCVTKMSVQLSLPDSFYVFFKILISRQVVK